MCFKGADSLDQMNWQIFLVKVCYSKSEFDIAMGNRPYSLEICHNTNMVQWENISHHLVTFGALQRFQNFLDKCRVDKKKVGN